MPILTGHKFHIGPLPQIGMTFQHRAQFFQPDPLWVWAENDGVRVPHSHLVDRVLLPHRLQLHLWIENRLPHVYGDLFRLPSPHRQL